MLTVLFKAAQKAVIGIPYCGILLEEENGHTVNDLGDFADNID